MPWGVRTSRRLKIAWVMGLVLLTASPALGYPFPGPKPAMGVGASFNQYGPESDQSLQLSYRDGDYGLISGFVVGELGYRFGREAAVASVGVEFWLTLVGVRVDAVLETGLADESYAPGVAVRAMVGASALFYLHVGGQTLYGRDTEFLLGLGFTHIWGDSPPKSTKKK